MALPLLLQELMAAAGEDEPPGVKAASLTSEVVARCLGAATEHRRSAPEIDAAVLEMREYC